MMKAVYTAASMLGIVAIAAASFAVLNTVWGGDGETHSPSDATELTSGAIMACGQGTPSTIGAVARFPEASSTSAFDAFPHIAGSASNSSGSLVALPAQTNVASATHSGAKAGLVQVPSRIPALQSCNMYLSDKPQDLKYKQAALGGLVEQGLVSEATLNGPGVIWMVADDPTSDADELVVTDVETPLTAASKGTITTYVTAIDRATGEATGAALTNWGSW